MIRPVTVRFKGGKEMACQSVQQPTEGGHHLIDKEHNADVVLEVPKGEKIPEGESWEIVKK